VLRVNKQLRFVLAISAFTLFNTMPPDLFVKQSVNDDETNRDSIVFFVGFPSAWSQRQQAIPINNDLRF